MIFGLLLCALSELHQNATVICVW